MGISRSATCTAAYLMHRLKLTAPEAIALIRQNRPICDPNEGFVEQLTLFHEMGMPLSVEQMTAAPLYQKFLYRLEVDRGQWYNVAPNVRNFRLGDEGVEGGEVVSTGGALSGGEAGSDSSQIKCKKCR